MNKQIIYLAIAAVVALVVSKLRPVPLGQSHVISDDEIRNSIEDVLNRYGESAARLVERIYRLETGHFKSGQFKKTFTAGMWGTKDEYPFGWSSLKRFHDQNPEFSPFDMGAVEMDDAGTSANFVKFPDLRHAMNFLAHVMQERNMNGGSWNSTNPDKQASYNETLSKITPKFLNQILI